MEDCVECLNRIDNAGIKLRNYITGCQEVSEDWDFKVKQTTPLVMHTITTLIF